MKVNLTPPSQDAAFNLLISLKTPSVRKLSLSFNCLESMKDS